MSHIYLTPPGDFVHIERTSYVVTRVAAETGEKMSRTYREASVDIKYLFGLGVALLAVHATGALDELLLDKGVINDAEYNQLKTEKAPVLSKRPTVKIGGRLMIDAAVYDSDDVDLNNATEVRRARLSAKGSIGEKWFYKAEYEFTDSGPDAIRDLYIGYRGPIPSTTLRVGQLAEYGSLEDSTSSKYITFMERAMPVLAFAPAEKRIGMGVDSHGDSWYAGAGIFGEHSGVNEDEDDGTGASARMAWAPVHADKRVVHAGIHGSWRQPGGDTLRLSAREETHVSDQRILDTAVISNVSSRVVYGLEAAGVLGRLSVQAEYLGATVSRDGYDDDQHHGFYLYGSWFLTGESRPYDIEYGVFGRAQPEQPAGEGGLGAWELAARFSNLDLNGDVYSGESDNITVGLNWYATAYIRFMLNYGNVSVSRADGDIDIDVLQMRAQVDF